MANDQNLLKGEATRFKSGDKAVDAGRKGGIKSGETKRRKRTMREVFDAISEADAPEDIRQKAQEMGLPVPLTLEEAYAIAMAKEIVNGNVQAYRAVAEVRGERKQDIGLTIESEQSKLSELLEQRKKRRK